MSLWHCYRTIYSRQTHKARFVHGCFFSWRRVKRWKVFKMRRHQWDTVTVEGNSLTAARSEGGKQEQDQAMFVLSRRFLISFSGLFSATGNSDKSTCLTQILLTDCSENNHCHKHKYRNSLSPWPPPLLSLSHSLHLDYAPSCGQFHTATSETQPHPFPLWFLHLLLYFYTTPLQQRNKKTEKPSCVSLALQGGWRFLQRPHDRYWQRKGIQ